MNTTAPPLNSAQLQPLPLEKLIKFVTFCQTLRSTLELRLTNLSSPSNCLPTDLVHVIAGAMSESTETIQQAWGQFNHEIWSMLGKIQLSEVDIHTYNECVLPLGTCVFSTLYVHLIELTDSFQAYRHLYPPTRVCNTSGCIGHRHSNNIKTLTEPVTYKATLFTLREGSLPIYTTSLYCRGKYIFIDMSLSSHCCIL